jgi:hypothetical protein
VFATIAGRYPPIDGEVDLVPAEVLEEILADQLEAGLGMVADGAVRVIATERDLAETVDAWRMAAGIVAALTAEAGVAAPPVKACLLGPLSIEGETTDAGPGPAERTRAAILALMEAGAPVVQIEEPWTASPAAATEDGRARAAVTWAALLAGVEGHVTLALPGGGATNVGADAMVAAPFASYLVDLILGPDDWREVGRLPGDRGVILGVADLRPGRVDTKEVLVWATRHAAAMGGRGLDRVGLTTSAGLEVLSREAARARLARLAETAALATLSGAKLAARLDPRSIDARSAALGRWEPRPRRGPVPRGGSQGG